MTIQETWKEYNDLWEIIWYDQSINHGRKDADMIQFAIEDCREIIAWLTEQVATNKDFIDTLEIKQNELKTLLSYEPNYFRKA